MQQMITLFWSTPSNHQYVFIIFHCRVAKYSQYSSEGIVVNLLGVDLVALAIVVVYLVAHPSYARQPLPEEERIQLSE